LYGHFDFRGEEREKWEEMKKKGHQRRADTLTPPHATPPERFRHRDSNDTAGGNFLLLRDAS